MASLRYALAEARRLRAAGDLARTAEVCLAILRTQPRVTEALSLLAGALHAAGQPAKAIPYLQRALSVLPADSTLQTQFGLALLDAGRAQEAVQALRTVLLQAPRSAALHYYLGNAWRLSGDLEQATRCYRAAILLDPALADAHGNLANTLHELGDLHAAVESYLAALAQRPTFAATWGNLAQTLLQLDRPDEAIQACHQALNLEPHLHGAWLTLGNALRAVGQTESAVAAFDRALALQPDHAGCRYNRGLANLALGDFETGWDDYEHRDVLAGMATIATRLPRWHGLRHGQPPTGETVLVHGEQGVGSQVMFGTCLPDMIAAGVRVVLACDARLVALFARSMPLAGEIALAACETISADADLGGATHYVPFGSLPGSMRRHASNSSRSFPGATMRSGYLVPDAGLVNHWHDQLRARGPALKVGISWRGGATSEQQRHRSLPLLDWLPVLQVPGVEFVSLQWGDVAAEAALLPAETELWQPRGLDPFADLEGVAGLCAALDLVISVDNSLAHLAGGVGSEVWLMLPDPADWRWQQTGSGCPWYPSVRLLRQPSRGNWKDLVHSVAGELTHWAKSQPEDTTRRRAAA